MSSKRRRHTHPPSAACASVDEPRTDRNLAFAALLLVATSFWLPWWVVRLEDGAGTTTSAFRLFRPYDPVTTAWAPHVAGALLVVVALALFVRLAGRSWYHEPAAWLRSLQGATVALGAALVSLVFWPASIPHAFGRRTLRDNQTMEVVATETALPGLGWWLTLAAAVCLGVAWWWARRDVGAAAQEDTSGK